MQDGTSRHRQSSCTFLDFGMPLPWSATVEPRGGPLAQQTPLSQLIRRPTGPTMRPQDHRTKAISVPRRKAKSKFFLHFAKKDGLTSMSRATWRRVSAAAGLTELQALHLAMSSFALQRGHRSWTNGFPEDLTGWDFSEFARWLRAADPAWVEDRTSQLKVGTARADLDEKLAAFDPKKHGGEAMADGAVGVEAFAR